MSSQPPSKPPSTKKASGWSRRGFIGGVGVGSTVIGAGVATPEAAQAAPTMGPSAVPISLKINGQVRKLEVEPRVTLLDALRNNLDLTGAKRVCDRGTCGACTVIIAGKVNYACTILAIDAQGKDIQTIEGIGTPERPHPVSAAFVQHDAQQCGYCTPGFVMAAKGFLDRNPKPKDESEVAAGLGGNLCRCGTYVGVRKAVLEASKNLPGGRNA